MVYEIQFLRILKMVSKMVSKLLTGVGICDVLEM